MDIFIKGNELKYINLHQVMDTIPKGSITTAQPELMEQGMTEWRWRFLKINNKPIAEISKKKLNQDRKYLSTKGEWVKHKNEGKKKVIKQYFYYSL